MHLAAESHVDRSITDPGAFIRTNVVGTQVMLDGARSHWDGLAGAEKAAFRFLHVSTDEVYGSLPPDGFFTEASRYDPRSPYSASKAASDHLARAWHETYGLPVLVTNCSNNYGPRHFPEKLIPLMILNALEGKPLPVYGDGLNERDWIHVEDHARGLVAVLERGRVGETYLLGGRSVRNNLAVVKALCAAFDRLRPEHLDQLYTVLLDAGYSPATVLRHHRILSRALTVAVQRGHVPRNVASLVDPPAQRPSDIATALDLGEDASTLAAALVIDQSASVIAKSEIARRAATGTPIQSGRFAAS